MSPSVSPIHKNQKSRKNDLQCRRNNQDDALNSGQGSAAKDGRRGKADRSHVNLGHFSLGGERRNNKECGEENGEIES